MRALLAIAALALSWQVFRVGAVNLTVADLALLGCLVLLLVRNRLNPLPFGSLTNLWCVGLALMLGGLLVSSIIQGRSDRWLIVSGQYLFAYLLLPMIVMSAERDFIRKCLVFYVLGVSLSQAGGLIASLFLTFQEVPAILGGEFLTGNGRVGALAGEANWNAATVAYALPILVNAMRHKQISIRLGLVCAVALIWGLLASASFTGFATTMVAMALMFGISSPSSFLKFGLPVIAAATIYVAAGFPLPGAFETRVAGALETGEMAKAGSFVGRSALVREAWDIAGNTVVLGLGVDGFRAASVHGAPVHLFPLLILTEGGAVALLGLLALFGTLLWLALRAMRIQPDDGAMALAALVVYCVFSFAIPHMYARLWIGPVILALGATYARSPLAARPRRPARGIPASGMWPPGAYRARQGRKPA